MTEMTITHGEEYIPDEEPETIVLEDVETGERRRYRRVETEDES